jgi:hypothetical protein
VDGKGGLTRAGRYGFAPGHSDRIRLSVDRRVGVFPLDILAQCRHVEHSVHSVSFPPAYAPSCAAWCILPPDTRALCLCHRCAVGTLADRVV